MTTPQPFLQQFNENVKGFEKRTRFLKLEWPTLKQEFLNSITSTLLNSNVKFDNSNFGKDFTSFKLPINTEKGLLAKDQLPYFSQFHYQTELDKELLTKLSIDKRSMLKFVGPSQSGKTSTCIRLLCKNPGLIFSYGEDSIMKDIVEYLSLVNVLTNGRVKKVINMVIICRLIYLLKLIENAKCNPQVFELFDGILPYMAFMQSHGKKSAFTEYAFKNSQYTSYSNEDFISISEKLITEIIQNLNNNAQLFKIENTISKFVIVVDDADIYTKESTMKENLANLVSDDGKKGLLPIVGMKLNYFTCQYFVEKMIFY